MSKKEELSLLHVTDSSLPGTAPQQTLVINECVNKQAVHLFIPFYFMLLHYGKGLPGSQAGLKLTL